ncbi:TetR/AcrR family transcriptional regulator [Hyphomonas sp.]|uniref:TetR/AcrR family transcriptional regulator n=1 Tax=Hyphomonas sp. TaxID=87 RepID=UPI0025C4970A|nr:TetR/AcrR family transcriptional regulator [Hyphomonas sp.]
MARTQALDYADKRSAIKETSAALFAKNGFHSASILDLAKACNMSKSSLYHYFASKDQVLYELLHDHAQTLIEVAEGIANNDALPAREKLLEFASQLLEINVKERDKHTLILNELEALPAVQRRKISKMLRKPIEVWFDVLTEINPSLGHNVDMQFPSAMMFIGMINWTHTWFSDRGPVSTKQFAHIMCETFLNGFPAVKL